MEYKGKGQSGKGRSGDGEYWMDWGGLWGKGRKTKEGEWWVEPGCEMTLLEHGFKYQNKVPELGVSLIQLSL